jgi:hypothetical protein
VETADALADLLEISSHIQAAVLADPGGGVTGSAGLDDARAASLAGTARQLLDATTGIRGEGSPVAWVEASFPEGGLFVVRDGERVVAATTTPEPPAALVLYDLRSVLKATAPEPPKPRRRTPRAKKSEDSDVAS